MQLMDYAPYDFVMQAEDQDYERFCNFKHRTFNSYDCVYFLKSLANIYRHHGGLKPFSGPTKSIKICLKF